MKILYVTTIGTTMAFRFLIERLLSEGNTVDIATNEMLSEVPQYYKNWGCKVYQISTSRSPFSLGNIKAIRQIRNIAKGYDIVHCHTPLAAASTRFACKNLRKTGIKVIYTAHGFHFYKGSPLINWALYYPIERLCSRWTDALITINSEDYELAKKKMKCKKVDFVLGVGIDTKKFLHNQTDAEQKRKEIGVPSGAKILLSVGELNKNKNHKYVIKALAKIQNQNIHYVIAGVGKEKRKLELLAKNKNVNLHLLGFRKDVADLYKVANLYILPSLREGLNVSIMEALSSGCKTIVSNIRGNIDLVKKDNCFSLSDIDSLINLINRDDICNNDIIDSIDSSVINDKYINIYNNVLGAGR